MHDTVIPYPKPSYILLTIPGFHESVFPGLFCLKLHNFNQKFSWGRTPDLPPHINTGNTFYATKNNHVKINFVWRKPILCMKKDFDHTDAVFF